MYKYSKYLRDANDVLIDNFDGRPVKHELYMFAYDCDHVKRYLIVVLESGIIIGNIAAGIILNISSMLRRR